jgi:hypothetical protein
MSYALAQLKEFPLATYNTYNDATSLNTAPLAANLNSTPCFSSTTHYQDEDGFECAVAGPMITLN